MWTKGREFDTKYIVSNIVALSPRAPGARRWFSDVKAVENVGRRQKWTKSAVGILIEILTF